MLIEFYDNRNRFVYQTKSRGKESLRETQLGLLAATTPSVPPEKRFLRTSSVQVLPVESYLSTRMNQGNQIIFPSYTDEQLIAKEFCVRALQRIATITDWCNPNRPRVLPSGSVIAIPEVLEPPVPRRPSTPRLRLASLHPHPQGRDQSPRSDTTRRRDFSN